VTEDELLTAIVEAAAFLGWRVHHDRRSDKAIQQGHAGFPDLVLARKGIVMFVELKAARGRLDAEQWSWALAVSPPEGLPGSNVRYRLWFPEDLDDALKELA